MYAVDFSIGINYTYILNDILDKNIDWIFSINYGIGVMQKNVSLNLYDQFGKPYSQLLQKLQWSFDKYDSSEGREELRQAQLKLYDDTFESQSGLSPLYYVTPTFEIRLSKEIWKGVNLGGSI